MGRGIPNKKVDWAGRIDSAKELYSPSMGTFSLNRASAEQVMPVLLYEYWNKDWESSCFIEGRDTEIECIEACESWLGKPCEGATPSPCDLEDHSRKEFSVTSWAIAHRVRGTVYWRTEVRTSRLQRQVSYVGEEDTYTFVQCLQEDRNVNIWRPLWAVKSTPDSLWFRSDQGLPPLDSMSGALIRVACMEHASSVLSGEDPQIGSTSGTRMRGAVDDLYHNPAWRGWIKVN